MGEKDERMMTYMSKMWPNETKRQVNCFDALMSGVICL